MGERLIVFAEPENVTAEVEIFDVIPQTPDAVAAEQNPVVIDQPPVIDLQPPATEIVPLLEKPSFEQHVATVMERVGNRIFTYKQHSGTAAEMAAMCPMARMAFMRGPEFAISFLEKFDGTPSDLEKKEEPEPDDIKADEPDMRHNEETKKESSDVADEPTAESRKVEQSPILKVVARAEKKALEIKTAEATEIGRKASIITATVAQVAIAAAKNETPERNDETIAVITAKTKEEQPKMIAVKETIEDEIVRPPLPFATVVDRNEQDAKPRIDDEETLTLDSSVEDAAQVTPIFEHESKTIAATAEPAQTGLEDSEKNEVAQLPTSTAVEPELLTVIEREQSDESDAAIHMRDEQEMDGKYDTLADETQNQDAADAQELDAKEGAELTSEVEGETQDHLSDAATDRSDAEPVAHATTIENQDAMESNNDPNDVLMQIIEEVTERAEHGDQAEIEKRVTMVVRSIEILKWARTGEECKDAVDQLKKNLEALFREQGYAEDVERLAAELLNEYSMRTIDETMNVALKNIRGMRTRTARLSAVRHLSIGRHVVRLLFGAGPGRASAYSAVS